jgi:hypothetical protein
MSYTKTEIETLIRNVKTRGARILPPVGGGGLHAEQNYCFSKGYREGVAALRKVLLEKIKKEKP